MADVFEDHLGWLLDAWTRQNGPVMVRTLAGSAGAGTVYDPPKGQPPREVRAFVSEKTRRVTGPDGSEVTSGSTVLVHLDDAHLFKPGSEVTIRGIRTTVIALDEVRDGGMGAPEHGQAACE